DYRTPRCHRDLVLRTRHVQAVSVRGTLHKHQLGYVERWTQPKDERTAAGRGTMWHQILDSHYTALKHRGGKREVTGAVAERVQGFRQAGKDPEVIDLLMWMYEGYLEK